MYNGPTDGIVLANKPGGVGSAGVVHRLKKAMNGQRCGHTGTLDRFAEGLMILTVGRATSFSDLFLKLDKTYEVTIQLGISTNTIDPHGTVTDSWSAERVADFVRHRRGDIEAVVVGRKQQTLQQPPVFAAIKQDGMRLSDRHRKGLDLELKARPVNFYQSECRSVSDSGEVTAFFSVSSGTYIRSAARDIGEELGIPAYVTQLRRMSVGRFSLSDEAVWSSLDDTPKILSLLDVFQDWQRLTVSNETAKQIVKSAMKIRLSDFLTVTDGENFFIVDESQNLIAWCRATDRQYTYKKVFT